MENNLKNINQDNEDIDIKRVYNFFTRNKFFISSTIFLFFFLTIIFSLFKTKTWQGDFEIVLDTEKNNLPNSLNQLNPILGEGINRESNLKTQVGILQSKSVLMPIFEFVKNEKLKNKNNYSYNFDSWRNDFLNISLKDKTSILNIAYRDTSKELIIPVLNKITLAYQDYSGKAKKRNTLLAKNYLEDQIIFYKKKSAKTIKNAQEYAIDKDLQTFDLYMNMPNLGIGNVNRNAFNRRGGGQNTQNNSFLLSNAGMESIRINASNQIKNIDAMLKKIKNKKDNEFSIYHLKASIPQLSNDSTIASQIDLLDRTLLELKSKYTEKDPALIKYLNKRKLLLKLLEERIIGYLKAEKISQESIIEATKRPKEVILKYKELMRLALRDELTLVNLENELRAVNLEQARIEDPWELISKPTLRLKPVAPRKSIYGLIGILIGLLIGSLISYYREIFTKIVYEKDYLQTNLGIKIIDEFDIKNKIFKNYSIDVFVNEIINSNKTKFYKFVKLGNISESEVESFINVLSNDKGLEFSLSRSLEQNNDNELLIILSRMGSFTMKELESLKIRLELSNKKVIGIILI